MTGSKAPWTVRNPFARKSLAIARRVPRALHRWAADPSWPREQPPLLANSFPKSGTHLLNQILRGFPGTTDYGTFLASMPSVRFRQVPDPRMAARIRRLGPGEVASGHLFHSREAAEALAGMNVVHFFIYRDPRDVVVSEAHYLDTMNRWHRLHRHFARLPDLASRIRFSIEGGGPDLRLDYPDVEARFERYAAWLDHEDVFPVRYEDLRGEGRDSTIREMAGWYASRVSSSALSTDAIVESALESVDPTRSHTYRKGGVGGWQTVFDDELRLVLKETAGQLLIRLGYEEDLDW